MAGRFTALHGLWLLVFAVDASMSGRGLGHQLGAVGLGVLFAALFVSELRAHRRAPQDAQPVSASPRWAESSASSSTAGIGRPNR